MTFWGFVFFTLLVFVAFYAWSRYARRNRELDARTDAMRRVNRPLLAETGTIGERDEPHAQPMPIGSKGPRVNTYMTEVGMIGQLTQGQPQLLLPPPRDYSAETGTIGEREDALISDTHAAYIHPNRTSAQADLHATTFHAQQQAVASENVGSNLSHVQSPSDDYGEAAWLENSDLVRLHGEPEPNVQTVHSRVQHGNEVFEQNMISDVSIGFFLPASLLEIGTIGERSDSSQPYPFDQAPRNTARRGYVHPSNVENGVKCQHENEFGLNTLPDQLPIADNQAHND